MKPLPVINADPWQSLWATMHFPDDDDLARACVSLVQHQTIPAAQAEGYDWSATQQQEFFRNFRANSPSLAQIQQRRHEGEVAGEIVRCLWSLICERPQKASWDLAIHLIEDLAVEHGISGGRTSFRSYLSHLAPVLDFWGAWRLRGSQLRSRPEISYSITDDMNAFVMEAMSLQAGLSDWASSRGRNDDHLISSLQFLPWTGWKPPAPKADWPELGGIPKAKLALEVPWPRPPGRKRKLRPASD